MFASSALVPTSTMPGWLHPFVEHQPVTLIVNAIRGLVLNRPDATATRQAIAWCGPPGGLDPGFRLGLWSPDRSMNRREPSLTF